MMRNGPSRAAVITPQETLPELIQLEQALINKLEVLQRNLNNELNDLSEKDHIEISPAARDRIRRIFLDAQGKLGNIARTYVRSNQLLNFYRDVNQFVQMVDDMETMFCQTLKKCAAKKEVSEEDDLLFGSDQSGSDSDSDSDSDSAPEKTAEELFSSFSANSKNSLLEDHSEMIRQIERVGELSGAIYAASRIVDKKSEEPIFLIRFFDARRIVSEAIEKVHYVIHPRDQQSNQHGSRADGEEKGGRRRPREAVPAAAEEYCYDFGLMLLCSTIKKQMRTLLEKVNPAQAKRLQILKMICSLANRMPESLSSTASSSSCTSSESSDSDYSSDTSSEAMTSRSSSSSASSGFFSRSTSPDPKNPNQSSAAPRY